LSIDNRLTGLSVKKFFLIAISTPYLFLRGSEPVQTYWRDAEQLNAQALAEGKVGG
jgi:hypothetical protein